MSQACPYRHRIREIRRARALMSRRRRLAKLHGTRLEAGKVRGIMSEAASGPELTVVDAIDTNLDLLLHGLRYRRHHMACDFITIDHLGIGKPRGHVHPPFGRRKPTNMRGPDTRRTLLHARSSQRSFATDEGCDAPGPHPSASYQPRHLMAREATTVRAG